MSPLVEIGLTDLPKTGGALACVSPDIYRIARMGQNFDDYPGFSKFMVCLYFCNTVYLIQISNDF